MRELVKFEEETLDLSLSAPRPHPGPLPGHVRTLRKWLFVSHKEVLTRNQICQYLDLGLSSLQARPAKNKYLLLNPLCLWHLMIATEAD